MYLYQQHRRFYAQTAGGIEEVAGNELKRLGATRVQTGKRGVVFTADPEALCRINYRARLISRVLAPLVEFPAHTPEDLYLGAKRIDWTRLMTLDQTFGIFANVHRSGITHSKYAALKVKDCVADMFRKRYLGKRPNVDAQDPDLSIGVHVLDDMATIFLDCSGGSLHRRGYRLEAVEAPMQETLAAAILDFAEWDGKRPLYDPMCGSGTHPGRGLAEGRQHPGRLPAQEVGLPDAAGPRQAHLDQGETGRGQRHPHGARRADPRQRHRSRRRRDDAPNVARIPTGDELRVRTLDYRDIDGHREQRDRLQSALRRAHAAGRRT